MLTKFATSLILLSLAAPVLYAQGQGKGENASKDVSIDEVATMIRSRTNWQILDASPRKQESGNPYFRFKLLGEGGKVKVIDIDPNKPNLGKLE